MDHLQKTFGFVLITIYLMIQYAQSESSSPIIYWHLAENKNVDNFVKNGRWSYPNPVLGIPPSRPRQFRNSEIISYFALDKEQKAKDKAADAIKKWITQEVSTNILHVSFQAIILFKYCS